MLAHLASAVVLVLGIEDWNVLSVERSQGWWRFVDALPGALGLIVLRPTVPFALHLAGAWFARTDGKMPTDFPPGP